MKGGSQMNNYLLVEFVNFSENISFDELTIKENVMKKVCAPVVPYGIWPPMCDVEIKCV